MYTYTLLVKNLEIKPMQTLLKLIYKDALLLIRDIGGLAMLFLMPVSLVLIMTYLQDTTFKSINESGIPLLLLNNDNDSLGITIERQLEKSNMFKISRTIKGQQPTEQMVEKAVASGNYLIGIIIPANTTKTIHNNVKYNVSLAFAGVQADPRKCDSVRFTIFIDPTTKISFRETLLSTIREFASRVENSITLNEITQEVNKRVMMPVSNLSLAGKGTVYYKEEYAAFGNRKIIPNSVQHNVPAWMLFAMFFIVISFASNMIKEREDGNVSRLLTMPCSYSEILISKIVVYMTVCLLQFILILLMGMFILPLIHLPSLAIGGSLFVLMFMGFVSALAAVGYGIAIGTIAQSQQQASIFASISIVILAAIGGIWVPVFAMPPFMRHLSILSPLNWGLEGFYDIFIRSANFMTILPHCIWLLLFFAGCLAVSIYFHKLRREFN
jgi:ABC-2 type transport system permease protein